MDTITIIISICSLLIALLALYSQYEMSKINLKLALLEKRLEIYNAALYLLQVALNHPLPKCNLIENFAEVNNAKDRLAATKFLFPEDENLNRFIHDLQTNFLMLQDGKNFDFSEINAKNLQHAFSSHLIIEEKNLYFLDKLKSKFHCPNSSSAL